MNETWKLIFIFCRLQGSSEVMFWYCLKKRNPYKQNLHGFVFLLKKWSWRDLNPRPNKELICFLHAYLRLNFREWGRPKPPTQTLAFLFQIRAKASLILSPICLHHLIGTLRSHSFRVMSCPYTCARIKLESTILRLSSKSVIVIAS